MLFAYMAGGEGWCVCVWGGGARGFRMFCQRGSEFFLLALCVCVCVCVCVCEGGLGSVPLFHEKITDPLLLINDCSL